MPKEMSMSRDMGMSKEMSMFNHGGLLYMQTNEVRNCVVHYRRGANGRDEAKVQQQLETTTVNTKEK